MGKAGRDSIFKHVISIGFRSTHLGSTQLASMDSDVVGGAQLSTARADSLCGRCPGAPGGVGGLLTCTATAWKVGIAVQQQVDV